MYRVELKAISPSSNGSSWVSSFLMYRVELKVRKDAEGFTLKLSKGS